MRNIVFASEARKDFEKWAERDKKHTSEYYH
jgi:hypothetical protein